MIFKKDVFHLSHVSVSLEFLQLVLGPLSAHLCLWLWAQHRLWQGVVEEGSQQGDEGHKLCSRLLLCILILILATNQLCDLEKVT